MLKKASLFSFTLSFNPLYLVSIKNSNNKKLKDMYAIVKIGGHQYKVAEDQTVFVNRIAEGEEKITLEDVLLIKDANGKVKIGKPTVKGAKVEATVVDHLKSDKVIVFKKKRRKGYRVKNGHRQAITQLKIDKIS